MTPFVVSLSFALLLTTIFAFRFRAWSSPKTLAAYFGVFFGLEWAMEALYLPEGALGMEVAYVCFGLTVLFAGAIWVVRKLEHSERQPR